MKSLKTLDRCPASYCSEDSLIIKSPQLSLQRFFHSWKQFLSTTLPYLIRFYHNQETIYKQFIYVTLEWWKHMENQFHEKFPNKRNDINNENGMNVKKLKTSTKTPIKFVNKESRGMEKPKNGTVQDNRLFRFWLDNIICRDMPGRGIANNNNINSDAKMLRMKYVCYVVKLRCFTLMTLVILPYSASSPPPPMMMWILVDDWNLSASGERTANRWIH